MENLKAKVFLAKSSKSFKKSYENLQEHFSDFSDHNEILSFWD